MKTKTIISTFIYLSLFTIASVISAVANLTFFIPKIIWGRISPSKTTTLPAAGNYYFDIYDYKFKNLIVADSKNMTVFALTLTFLLNIMVSGICFFGAHARDIQYSAGSFWQKMIHYAYHVCIIDSVYTQTSADLPTDFHKNDTDLKYVIENLAAPYVEQVDDGYVIDLLSMQTYPVRDPIYYKFGAKLCLDSNFHIVSIETADVNDQTKNTVYFPKTDFWDYSKMIFIGSVFMHATVVEHLINTHLIFGSMMSNATYGALSENNELFTFLKPHTSYIYIVNKSAEYFLINKLSLLTIATPYSYDVLKEIINKATIEFKYVNFRNRIDKCLQIDNQKHYPFGYFSKKYFEVIKTYVTQYFMYYGYDKLDYSNLPCELTNFITTLNSSNEEVLNPDIEINSFDDFVDLLTFYIYIVTVYHETIGGNPEKLIYSYMKPLILIQKNFDVSLLSETCTFVIGVINNFGRVSRLIDLQSHSDDPHIVTVTKEFINKLHLLSSDIRSYNYKFDKHYDAIDPHLLETHAQY